MVCSVPIAQSGATTGIFFWSLLLMGLLVCLFLAVWWVRRNAVGRGASGSAEGAFTLLELRRLRDAGEIDDQQFEKLREKIIGAARNQHE